MKFFISFILLRLGLSGALIWYIGSRLVAGKGRRKISGNLSQSLLKIGYICSGLGAGCEGIAWFI